MQRTYPSYIGEPCALPYTRDVLKDYIEKFEFEVGEHSYGTPVINWWGEPSRLFIGKYCSIADGTRFVLGGNHRADWVTTYPFSHSDQWPEAHGIAGVPTSKGHIRVGNDVWFGIGSVILSGVTIGDGAVIGAYSVVSRDVAPYSVVAGNPALERRRRFSDVNINKLLEMRWWDWNEAHIRQHMKLLMSADIDALYAQWQAA